MTEQTALNELFSEVALKHPLWNHEFLVRCREGSLREEEVRVLAGQMYKFCKEFNRILVSAFQHCPDEHARMVIAESLFDEMGRGDPNQTHAELFRRFTRAIGITDEELEAMPIRLETQEMTRPAPSEWPRRCPRWDPGRCSYRLLPSLAAGRGAA